LDAAVTEQSERRVGLVFDDRFLAHNTGLQLIEDVEPHPFAEPIPHISGPGLVGRAKQLIDLAGISDFMVRIPAHEASDDDLLTYHTAEYLDHVWSVAKTGGDTGQGAPIGKGGDRIARLSAGGVIAAVDAVLTGDVDAAYALVRPPGHHAMAGHGMGFCVFNNVVVAAKHAQRAHGIERVLILDWDVHHGNGTQDAFYADPSVLFISLHQDDLYPVGWGKRVNCGEGEGRGFTVNIPLPAGTGGIGYRRAFEQIVTPIVRQFQPELIIVSAGQDASVMDPLARMALTTANYREMTASMLSLAAELCNGRIVIAQEGGYAPYYAPYCSAAIAETLVGPRLSIEPVAEPYGRRAASMPAATTLGLDAQQAIEAAVHVQQRFWTLEYRLTKTTIAGEKITKNSRQKS
jgi:acetoin utilization deacetylase AcuC-like enzyme